MQQESGERTHDLYRHTREGSGRRIRPGRIIGIDDIASALRLVNARPTDFAYATTSNQLTASSGGMAKTYSYDAIGNIVSDGGFVFSYDGRGRMAQASKYGVATQYGVNGLGQRVAKTESNVSGVAAYFVYDEQGHLLGEYDATGAVIQETVWLGDMPVGVLKPGAQYSVNPDHLGAPLTVTDANGALAWRWDRDPYGDVQPNQNPSKLGLFVYNLRLPGQYYDSETGLHYNYFRDYNPKTGRYVQADPIGLAAGINPYFYVEGDPVSYYDPRGTFAALAASGLAVGIEALGTAVTTVTVGVLAAVGADKLSNVLLSKQKSNSKEEKSKEEKSRQSKPKGCPPGTIPIDQVPELSREQRHKIKHNLKAGPQDYVGIDRDGNAHTGDSNGEDENRGPYELWL